MEVTKDFAVATFNREDLKEYFTAAQIASLTDEDLTWVAGKMGDAYQDNGFWDDLELYVGEALDHQGTA
jgi:hypothetical protein